MNFSELIKVRQSCRAYAPDRPVEEEKLQAVLEAARLSPSACNGLPWHLTVCRGDTAREVAQATSGMGGINRFATQAPILLVLSEKPYAKTAAIGAKIKNNDYRSLDMGIAAAHITLQAADLGLGTCILGWFDDARVRKLCFLDAPVRLIITLGYPKEGDPIRPKKRKELSELVSFPD